jgi:hypothetical protein
VFRVGFTVLLCMLALLEGLGGGGVAKRTPPTATATLPQATLRFTLHSGRPGTWICLRGKRGCKLVLPRRP